MPDPRFDESQFAERVAAHLGTTHTTLEVAARPADDTVHLVERLGRPLGDSSILPTHWVSRAAREHVKVAISGDGADELFLGYERYVAARALHRWHTALRLFPRGAGARAHPKSALAKAGRLGHMAREYRRLGILAMESVFTQDQIERLTGAAPAAPPAWPADADARASLRAADLVSYLPDDLLAKVDAASMAVALEVRCPYLDRDLATLVLSAPLDRLMPGGRRKGLLRTIAHRHLPPECIDRPKMGFAVPIDQWFRTDHGGMKALLLDQLGARAPFGPIALDRREVRRLIDDHLERRRDHGHRLFALLTLSLWARGR
jgi:asparagine synthase (glutamine-hydrolysing)